MTYIQAIILGIVQGLTEFLPVSSSAHLVLTPFFFQWQIPEDQIFPFDVLVQLGTLLAVIIYFWKDLLKILIAFFQGIWNRTPFATADSRLGWYIILATIPAGLGGIFLKDVVEAAFQSVIATACFLIVTALLLTLAEVFGKRSRELDSMSWKDALWVGFAQVISIFPGVSRSGSTITGGMTRNFDRASAARFSFLMSIPIMTAAGLLSVVQDLTAIQNLSAFAPKLLIGFFVAGIVGYLSIHWLLNFVRKHSLYYFAGYCVLLSIVTLIVSYAR